MCVNYVVQVGVLVLCEVIENMSVIIQHSCVAEKISDEPAIILFHNRPPTFEHAVLTFSLFHITRDDDLPDCPWTHHLLLPFFLLLMTKILTQQIWPRLKSIHLTGIPVVTACVYNDLGDEIEIYAKIQPCFRESIVDCLVTIDIEWNLFDEMIELVFDEEKCTPLNDVIVMTFITCLFCIQ